MVVMTDVCTRVIVKEMKPVMKIQENVPLDVMLTAEMVTCILETGVVLDAK